MATKREIWHVIQYSGDDDLIEFVREMGQAFGLQRVEYGGLVWERGNTGERR